MPYAPLQACPWGAEGREHATYHTQLVYVADDRTNSLKYSQAHESN